MIETRTFILFTANDIFAKKMDVSFLILFLGLKPKKVEEKLLQPFASTVWKFLLHTD